MSAPDHSYRLDSSYDDDAARHVAEYERRPLVKSHRSRRHHSRSSKSASMNGIHRRRNKRWSW